MTHVTQVPAADLHAPGSLSVALAALAVVESLIVTLVERKLVSEDDLRAALQDAVDSHLHAEPSMLTTADHLEAARVIARFSQGANAVRASARL